MGYKQMRRQMGEMFKSFTLGSQRSNQNQNQQPSLWAYQPIVGTVGSTPVQPPPRSTSYQTQREYRPRGGEITCFRCGGKGHRAYDCVNYPLPREEQDRLRNEFIRATGLRNSGPYPS